MKKSVILSIVLSVITLSSCSMTSLDDDFVTTPVDEEALVPEMATANRPSGTTYAGKIWKETYTFACVASIFEAESADVTEVINEDADTHYFYVIMSAADYEQRVDLYITADYEDVKAGHGTVYVTSKYLKLDKYEVYADQLVINNVNGDVYISTDEFLVARNSLLK